MRPARLGPGRLQLVVIAGAAAVIALAAVLGADAQQRRLALPSRPAPGALALR